MGQINRIHRIVLGSLFLSAIIASSVRPQAGSVLDSLRWVRTGGPPGGLGYDIRYNYGNPDIWYVTDSYAGLHISTDNGQTWQPSYSGIPPQAGITGDAVPVFCVTVDPLHPQILWAGTQNTGHIYKSTDGGHTWTQSDHGVSIGYDALSFRGFTVHPQSSDTVYAMGETTSHAVEADATGGVVYRTADGGLNWEVVWEGAMPSSLTRYMWIDPRDPNVMFVSTGIFDRGAVGQDDPANPFGGLGILKTTDGGLHWIELDTANGLTVPHIGSLFMHPQNPDILLAAAGHMISPAMGQYIEDLLNEGRQNPMGVYRTTNAGENWTQVLAPPPERINEIFSAVELSETDPNIGYAASLLAVYRTDDAGETWTQVSGTSAGWGPPGIQAGQPIDIQCDPRDPNRLFVNSYGGGNFLSEDSGLTWQNASQGYTGAITGSVAIDPGKANIIYVTGRSGIWSSEDGGRQWIGLQYLPSDLEWTECTAIQVDPSNHDHLLVGCWPGAVMESEDRGRSWQVRYRADHDSVPGDTWLQTASTFAFAPSDPTTIYAGVAWRGGLYTHEIGILSLSLLASHDGGKTWERATDSHLDSLAVFDVAVDPVDAQTVFAAAETGLFKSTDAGTSWNLIEGGLPPDVRVRAVSISPNEPDYMLAGVDKHGVYLSHDAGNTWEMASVGLAPNNSIHDIIFDPTNVQVVYVSDALSGVYRSNDGGLTWMEMNNGLRTRAALGIAVSSDGQHLYVATNGEGVFRLDLNGTPVSTDEFEMTPLTLGIEQNFPNPFNPTTKITITLPRAGVVTLRVFDLLGREVSLLLNERKGAGTYTVRWDAEGYPNGIYFCRLIAGEFTETKKMVLMK